MHKIFVYGTLKQGEANHILLAGRSMFVSENTIKGELFDLGPFPAVKEGEQNVFGEVYIVSEETLAELDCLEGHPILFERREVSLNFSLDKHDKAFVYFYKEEFHGVVKKLPDGIWKRNRAYK